MTAHDLLSQLRAKGVDIKTSGDDRLVIDAPRGTITDELRTALSANKAALIQLLKTENTGDEGARDLNAAPAPAPAARVMPEAPAAVRANESVFQQTDSLSYPMAPPVAEAPKPGKDEIASSTDEEIAQLEIELKRLRSEESARRVEVDAARMTAEDLLRSEQARWDEQEQEMARRRAEHERQRIDREARDRAEEDQRRQIAEHEIEEAEKIVLRLCSAEEYRRHLAADRMRAEQQSHEAELAS